MTWLLQALGLWGLADSLWLAVAPASWARFWGRWLDRAEAGGVFARALAATEFVASLGLIIGVSRARRRRR